MLKYKGLPVLKMLEVVNGNTKDFCLLVEFADRSNSVLRPSFEDLMEHVKCEETTFDKK